MKTDVLTSGYVSMDHIIKIDTPAKVGFTSLVTNQSNAQIFYAFPDRNCCSVSE